MNKVVACLALLTSLTLASGAIAEAGAIRSGATLQTIFADTRGSVVGYDSVNHVYLVVSSKGILSGRFVDRAGVPIGNRFIIQATANFTHFPTIAFSPDADGGAGGFLVVWHESVLPTLAAIKSRVVSFGKGGATGGESLLSAEGSFWEQYPAAAYSTVSQEFLVTWPKFGFGIRAIRTDNAGVPKSAMFTIALTGQYEANPSVAYNPTTNQFLVAYQGWNDAGNFGFVEARLVQAGATQLLGAAPTRLHQGGANNITDVAYNPDTNQFLVAWYRDAGGSAKTTLGRLVNADAGPSGNVIAISSLWKAYDGLGLAYNRRSGTFFMVSHDGRGLPTSVEDGGAELDKTGTPFDNGFLVTQGDGKPNFYPRIAASTDDPTWLISTAHNFQWTATQLIAGTASPGAPSDPTPGNPTTPPPPSGPIMAVDQSSLVFSAVSGSSARTTSQSLRLSQTGAGTVTWTVSSSAAWLQVSPTSGTGAGALTVSLVAGAIPAATTSASITFTATGAGNTLSPVTVNLAVMTAAASKAPEGTVDSPANNLTGVTGSMAMTGWAIDDVDVSRVRILRDPVAGEPAGLVYLGDATFVDGARPDVAAFYPTKPQSARAGWGYLLLTNMLPGLGNGTFKFSAYADDADGHTTLLGTRTITCSNATMTQPFGALDTPTPGETVAGTYTSFGWVLALGTQRADVPGGGIVSVVIDGTVVGSPGGWTGRADLSALFPVAQYSGIGSALAVFNFDTTTLTNGMHTIAWVVTDNKGNAAGVGSRYFRVMNGGSVMASMTSASSSNLALAIADTDATDARRGYAMDAAFRRYDADASGRVTLQSEELDRIELQTHGATDGFMVVADGLRPLPIGSRLDAATGMFVWQPGVAFIGSYDLAFVRQSGGRLVRQDVRIVLNPKGSGRVGPQIVVDLVGPVVAGWAADLDSPVDRGIDLIHVWAYPTSGASPVFVGEASYGGQRPDVAAVYGERFQKTGYGIRVQGLDPGTYDLAIFAWSSAKAAWLPAKVVRIQVGR